ncbi:CGA synthase-related protein [Streptomyces sp. NPDC051162]|uniref:CGA synthase-related protein n=1 Tax=Streptomyces sp. NPDC051162 TaxID=3154747 RepID=UPI00343129D5
MAVLSPEPHGGRAGALPPRRVLLVSRDAELDSLLARHRIAAHLGELTTVRVVSGGALPDAALVCDDEAATERLLELGVPVVHLTSGHSGAVPSPAPDGRALHRLHRPGWLPGPWPGSGGRPTGILAPARLTGNRTRAGTLLLLSSWGVPGDEFEGFTAGPLRALVRAAVRRTGRCEVVCDTRLAPVRTAVEGLAGPEGVRLSRAADVDVDALHATAAVFLASPTLGALALAQARRAPVVFLPPLGPVQRDLAERVARAVPVPVTTDGEDASSWGSRGEGPWAALDPDLDDLRGAQRVARSLRQLSLAPM